jgi:chorismate mutase / prephenate dehydrogenase
MKLNNMRNKIDRLDNKLIKLLSKRLRLSKRFIQSKLKNNLPLKDVKREKYILDKNKKLAKKLKLDPKFIEDISKKILNESKKR